VIEKTFRRLGEALNTAWSHANFDEHAFPALASAALTRAGLHVGFSPSDYARSLLLRDPGEAESSGSSRELPIVPAPEPGLPTGGFPWQNDEELRAYLRRLTSAGARVVWRVNHGDFIHGVYVKDPSGNLLELFVDGDEARALVARGAFAETREVTLANYELGLEELS